jgi:hypothetical protein
VTVDLGGGLVIDTEGDMRTGCPASRAADPQPARGLSSGRTRATVGHAFPGGDDVEYLALLVPAMTLVGLPLIDRLERWAVSADSRLPPAEPGGVLPPTGSGDSA